MTALVEATDLHVSFRVGRKQTLRAVDGVDLELERGESLGIVGESGCGKSTLARALCGLVDPTSGAVAVDGEALPRKRSPQLRRRIQIVFQDPTASLNPRRTVGQTLEELLRVHGIVQDPRARALELLELVELPERAIDAYPRQLSGGQRQRVGIARALAVEPEVLIADEAVSALDVSVQASILRLLARLRDQLGLTLVLISHDLAVVRSVCDRVAVMYLGRIVEVGPTAAIFRAPQHPYTRALLTAAPRLDVVRAPGEGALAGDPPSPLDVPAGCRFHPRCPLAMDRCRAEEPPLVAGAACWLTPAS